MSPPPALSSSGLPPDAGAGAATPPPAPSPGYAVQPLAADGAPAAAAEAEHSDLVRRISALHDRMSKVSADALTALGTNDGGGSDTASVATESRSVRRRPPPPPPSASGTARPLGEGAAPQS